MSKTWKNLTTDPGNKILHPLKLPSDNENYLYKTLIDYKSNRWNCILRIFKKLKIKIKKMR